ncbi:MAG: LysR family transcriptional regulator [Hyphomicrobiaceae bacterium]
MDIQDLKIFARVARLQNLSAVGAEFDLSAGTISKRLQALEAELSVRLFDRTTRSISMTEEGEKLLAGLEPVLDRLEFTLETVNANVLRPRGRLRISAPNSLGRGVIAPAICAFMKTYPGIEVHIDLTDRVVTFPDSGYDVAIRTRHLSDSSLIAKRLAPYPQVIVASPNYLAQHGVPRTPEDLAGDHACLVLGDEQQWTFKIGDDPTDVRIKARLRSDNGELLRHAAVEGLGILKIAHARVADALADGDLEQILPQFDAGWDSAIWAVYPSNRHLLPKLRVFLEFMSEWYKECRKAGTGVAGFADHQTEVAT